MRVVVDTNVLVSAVLGGTLKDPTDNKFLDAALAASADYVVSGDAHILDLESFRGIPILTARKFIDRLPA